MIPARGIALVLTANGNTEKRCGRVIVYTTP